MYIQCFPQHLQLRLPGSEMYRAELLFSEDDFGAGFSALLSLYV